VVAPTSTIDKNTASGKDIVIEERPAREILTFGENSIAPADTPVWNPSFDITPAELIDVLVTEQGFYKPVARKSPNL
jgi:methylthioribose-1-phosphate isomerase